MQWGTEMVIRYQLGKDINQKKTEKSTDITPLLSIKLTTETTRWHQTNENGRPCWNNIML
jgi:hypothetical protein